MELSYAMLINAKQSYLFRIVKTMAGEMLKSYVMSIPWTFISFRRSFVILVKRIVAKDQFKTKMKLLWAVNILDSSVLSKIITHKFSFHHFLYKRTECPALYLDEHPIYRIFQRVNYLEHILNSVPPVTKQIAELRRANLKTQTAKWQFLKKICFNFRPYQKSRSY